jgi:hypothetical protein
MSQRHSIGPAYFEVLRRCGSCKGPVRSVIIVEVLESIDETGDFFDFAGDFDAGVELVSPCAVASFIALAAAALMPSRAPQTTSLTPRSAATPELARKIRPEGQGLRGAEGEGQNLAPPCVRIDADRNDCRDQDNAVVFSRAFPSVAPIPG